MLQANGIPLHFITFVVYFKNQNLSTRISRTKCYSITVIEKKNLETWENSAAHW